MSHLLGLQETEHLVEEVHQCQCQNIEFPSQWVTLVKLVDPFREAPPLSLHYSVVHL